MLIALLLVLACAAIALYDIKTQQWGIGTFRVLAGLAVVAVVLTYRILA